MPAGYAVALVPQLRFGADKRAFAWVHQSYPAAPACALTPGITARQAYATEVTIAMSFRLCIRLAHHTHSINSGASNRKSFTCNTLRIVRHIHTNGLHVPFVTSMLMRWYTDRAARIRRLAGPCVSGANTG